MDAIKQLAAEAGLQVPEQDPQAIKRAEKAKDLHDLMAATTQFFQDSLMDAKNRDIQDYLKDRGITQQDITRFRIGFAPADGQALRIHLKQNGFTEKDGIEAGVLKASQRGTDPYAFFRDRVMFPVTDRRGRVIAFGGRAIPESMRPPSNSDFKPPKYINSSDTPLFDKSRVLYAASLANQAAGDGQPLIVTEGYMDVIACHRAGFAGAVAPMGTALTENQIILLWKMIPAEEKTPILCFDGDNAGRRAAARAAERALPLLQPNHSLRFAFLPEGEDPDTLIKNKGAKAFENILNSAQTMLDFIWTLNTQGRTFETPEQRAGLRKNLDDMVASIQHADIQAHYKSLISRKISDTFFTRQSNFKGGKSSNYKSPVNIIKPKAPALSRLMPVVLMVGVINHPHIYGNVEEEFATLHFTNPRLELLRQEITNLLASNPDLDNEALKTHLNDAGFEKELRDICNENIYVHAVFVAPWSDSQEVLHKWNQIYKATQEQKIKEEHKQGWHKALAESDTQSEQNLSQVAGTGDTESIF